MSVSLSGRMTKLWRTASYLFWQYPRLWLPVLGAEIASYCVKCLQKIISHQIALWVYSTGSVLSSGQDVVASRSEALKAVILAAPFLWGSYFVSIFLYTCALLATARILSAILDPGLVGFTLRSRIPDALKFSLKLFALCASGAILLAPLTALIGALVSHDALVNPFFMGAAVLLFSSGTAFIMAPAAVRLVSTGQAETSCDQVTSSRISACVAIAASMVLGLALSQAHVPVWDSWRNHERAVLTALGLIEGIVTAIPYIPLFNALYLIANDAPEIPDDLQLQTTNN